MKKITYLAIVLLSIGLFALSCGKDDGSDAPKPNPEPTSIVLNNSSLELNSLDSGQLMITNLNEFDNPEVVWGVNNDDILEVDENGNIFALKAGETIVTATIGKLVATCTITINASIFVAGEEHNGNNNVAKVWKNGEETALSIDGRDAYANGVAVHSKDIYAVGQERKEGVFFGKVWKNGTVLYTLTDVSQDARVNSIFITESGEIYSAGYVYENGVAKATVWKNGGVLYTLNANDDNYAKANSVFVVDGVDVLVGGQERVEGKWIARVWVNGEILYTMNGNGNNPNSSLNATSVVMSDSDVFIAGYEDLGEGLVVIAMLWENGEKLYSSISEGRANHTSVFVDNDDVFATGNEYDGSQYLAKTWRNGIGSTITTNDDGASLGNSIFVYDSKSFVAGYEYNENSNKVGKVWREGEELFSLTSETGSGSANSIFIK